MAATHSAALDCDCSHVLNFEEYHEALELFCVSDRYCGGKQNTRFRLMTFGEHRGYNMLGYLQEGSRGNLSLKTE